MYASRHGENLVLQKPASPRRVLSNDALAFARFYQDNAEHLQPWEPLRGLDYHQTEAWQQRIDTWLEQQKNRQAMYFVSTSSNNEEIIAHCALTNIIQGAFQACYLSYAIAEVHQGKGIMYQVCRYVLDYSFNELQLNRVMANYMPSNKRSEGLLLRLGFEKEGFAKNYLKINGAWEDHVMTSLRREQYLSTASLDVASR